jgi:hypothetical protein
MANHILLRGFGGKRLVTGGYGASVPVIPGTDVPRVTLNVTQSRATANVVAVRQTINVRHED